MKIDLNHVFATLDGEPVLKKGNKPFTLKEACVQALTSMVDERASGEEKVRRAVLAEQIYKSNGQVDFPVEDVALIKKLIGISGSPLVVKQAWDVLDPKENQ